MAILVLWPHWQGLCDTTNDYDNLTHTHMQRYVIHFSKSNMFRNFITSFFLSLPPKMRVLFKQYTTDIWNTESPRFWEFQVTKLQKKKVEKELE